MDFYRNEKDCDKRIGAAASVHNTEDGDTPPVKGLLQQSEESVVMAYICKIKDAGAFNLDKCFEKGMVSDKMISRLRHGENAVTDDGQTISPEEVRDPNKPGPVVLGRLLLRLFALEKCETPLVFVI